MRRRKAGRVACKRQSEPFEVHPWLHGQRTKAYVPHRANDPLMRRLWLLERDTRLRELRGHGVRVANRSPLLPIDTAL